MIASIERSEWVFFVGVTISLWLICLVVEARLDTKLKVLAKLFRTTVLPSVVGLWALDRVCGYERESLELKIAQTIVGASLVWLMATAFKVCLFTASARDTVLSRTPVLLVDIFRLLIVVVGGMILYSSVWQKDVSPILTTFGVGSLVLGLALQDTLGNLFAGLALVFERPLAVGDWIQLGDLTGKVQQINWRSVRILTREMTEITIPNSAIGKDRILNFSSPFRAHGFKISVGFSYDAPPNQVKAVLEAAACDTPGVVSSPVPEARTLEFGAYAIQYELRVFIDDYDDFVGVRNELMSRIWYAARRSNLTIPYPITTMYTTEIPYAPQPALEKAGLAAILERAELFESLSHDESLRLASEVTLERFGRGERIIAEGDVGECFYIIVSGTASVSVCGIDGKLVAVSELQPGAVFGEMSLLAGGSRTASVFATSDIVIARIGKEALSHLLAVRPDLLESFAHYAAERTKQIAAARDQDTQHSKTEGVVDERALSERLRRFFGLS
jgi:small-conductance mechanosensitive channel/CRP-like cAMP-binding protein